MNCLDQGNSQFFCTILNHIPEKLKAHLFFPDQKFTKEIDIALGSEESDIMTNLSLNSNIT